MAPNYFQKNPNDLTGKNFFYDFKIFIKWVLFFINEKYSKKKQKKKTNKSRPWWTTYKNVLVRSFVRSRRCVVVEIRIGWWWRWDRGMERIYFGYTHVFCCCLLLVVLFLSFLFQNWLNYKTSAEQKTHTPNISTFICLFIEARK